MWGRKENEKLGDSSQPEEGIGQVPVAPQAPVPSGLAGTGEAKLGSGSRIGGTAVFKGTIEARENLAIDGTVEGHIFVRDHMLEIGPEGNVSAEVTARSLVVHGVLKGKVRVRDRMEIKASGRLEGSLVTHRIIVHDGAVFSGSCDILKPDEQQAPKGKAGPSVAPVRKVGLPRPSPRPVKAKAGPAKLK